MNTKELLQLTPEELASKQLEGLQSAVIERLTEVIKKIENGGFNGVDKFLRHSPSGDGTGCENDYINFAHLMDDKHGHGVDIGCVVKRMQELKKIKQEKENETMV